MAGAPKRWLPAAICGLLAMWTIGLVVVQLTRDDTQSPRTEPLVMPSRTVFRAGALPKGVDGARAPQFTLDDARGGRLSTTQLSGQPYLVTFLYAACTDVCPLIGQEIKQALRRLGAGTRGDGRRCQRRPAQRHAARRPRVAYAAAAARELPLPHRYAPRACTRLESALRSRAAARPRGERALGEHLARRSQRALAREVLRWHPRRPGRHRPRPAHPAQRAPMTTAARAASS